MYKNYFKRIIDFLCALFLFLLFFPLFLIVFLLLTFLNKGAGALFFQKRPGKNDKIFKIIKFKTMTDEVDIYGNLLPDIERLTNVGKFVRSTSIDELPQLINVLKGDMSFVGPRPLRVHYLPLYSVEQRRRHDVHPGITGWAQVNGRNNIAWGDKFKFDIWYVDHCSFIVDMKILYLTVMKIFKRADINAEGEVTTYPFNGNN